VKADSVEEAVEFAKVVPYYRVKEIVEVRKIAKGDGVH
jgi:hypothetical protein